MRCGEVATRAKGVCLVVNFEWDTMKKKAEKHPKRDDLRREYDLSKLPGAARGNYATRYRAGTNLVLLSPDVAKHFPDEHAVNTALRALIRESKARTGAR